jgi:hypothetical protein
VWLNSGSLLYRSGQLEVSYPQELSTVVIAMIDDQLRLSATLLVLSFLYLMPNETVADMWTTFDGDSYATSLVCV